MAVEAALAEVLISYRALEKAREAAASVQEISDSGWSGLSRVHVACDRGEDNAWPTLICRF